MLSLELKVKGLERFRKLTRNFPKATTRLGKEVRKRIADELVDELVTQTRAHKKVVTAHLINDIYSKVDRNRTVVYFGKPRSAYAVHVDLGSRNKRPPNPMKTRIGYSLYEWVLLRGLQPRPRRRTYPGTKKEYGRPFTPTRKQLAYMIARSLVKKRIKATHITRKAYRRTLRKIDRIISEEVERIARIYGL